jgi:HK97 family phage major capsid protein
MSDKNDNKPETPVDGTVNEVVERNAEPRSRRSATTRKSSSGPRSSARVQMARECCSSRQGSLDDVRAKINAERATNASLQSAFRRSARRHRSKHARQRPGQERGISQHRTEQPKQKRSVYVETNVLPSELFKRSTYSGSGDSLTGYDRQPGIITLGQQQPTVADLFMQAQTDSPTIRYMREVSYTNAADATLEGDEKPEASFDLEEADATVRKVAVWSKVTDETLEDFRRSARTSISVFRSWSRPRSTASY